MDQDCWRRIEETFHRAAALPEAERAAFLALLPDDDADLRVEVESLLAVSADVDPVVEIVEEALQEVVFEGTDDKEFGPYRAERWLGGGSQSDVYLAERTDGEYRAKVAIKVAKRGFPTEGLRRRFRQERQILASLVHPHIARILDGGTTADGLPFFVMEYVDGEPVDRYCDRRHLSIRARLELFLQVCSAVAHAHRNLTIHRDLKPGNILVATDGRPILLDFGIAKLLAAPAQLDLAVETVAGLRVMTPAYASPEQVLGRPLTTATDVYSLGVILYELLCGRPPYELKGLEPKNLYETVCEFEPSTPSRTLAAAKRSDPAVLEVHDAVAGARATTAEGLRQQLRGDLDTVVLKTLRKDPERRYASVAALAEDLERHLRYRPIRARKETPGYRFAKLVRRHPYGFAATLALVLAISLGVVSTLRATSVARAERDQARRNYAEAERVTEFMVGLFEFSSPEVSLGETVSAVEILDRGAELITDELGEQPLRRARMLDAMGRAYHGLGLYDRAAEFFEQALAERRRELGPDHREIAEGLLDLARSKIAAADYPAARQAVERGLEIYSTLGSVADLERAAALNLLAEVRQHEGAVDAAEELYRQALDLRTLRLGDGHLETLDSLNDLAEILFERRRLEEADELFDRVLKGRRQLLSDAHPDVVKTLSNLAVVRQASGDLEGAEATMREVVAARQRLYGEKHPHVVLAYGNLGQVLSMQDEDEEALIWLERALDLSAELYGSDHPRVTDLLYALALVSEKQGRYEEAEERLEEALAGRRQALGNEHPAVAQIWVALAAVHQRLGHTEQALEEARRSEEILAAALPEGDYRRSSPQLQIGLILAAAGNCEEALPWLERALALRRRYLGDGHPALEEGMATRRRCG